MSDVNRTIFTGPRYIKVWLCFFPDRPAIQLQWHEQETKKRRTMSSRTSDPAVAEARRLALELQLNNCAVGHPSGKRKRSWKPQWGCAYLIDGTNGVFKLGKSRNPLRRVDELQVGFHAPLKLLHQIVSNDMVWLEELWKERFAYRHLRGEWYALESDDVKRFRHVALWNRGEKPIYGIFIEDSWYEDRYSEK